MGAVLACGPGAVLSHGAAACHLGLLPAIPDGPIDVTAGGRARRARSGIRLHLPRHLAAPEVSVHDGIPITTVPRLLVDLAPWTADDALEDLLRQARRRGLVDARALAAHLRRPRPGTAAVRGLLDPDRPDLRQELERRFQRFVRRAGLPAPETNAWLPTPLGPLLVDAVWLGPRFVVELDSWRHHGDRDAFETDREREIAAELAGYATRRVTWRMLTRRPDVVRALLARRLG